MKHYKETYSPIALCMSVALPIMNVPGQNQEVIVFDVNGVQPSLQDLEMLQNRSDDEGYFVIKSVQLRVLGMTWGD